MTTIRDVAARAGVSVATVSRVLNGSGYVGKDTEIRVKKAIQELNYRPNTVARSLANRKTGTIAVILPDIMNPFFSELARAVEDTARDGGFTVIFCNSDDLGTREQHYIEVLRQKYIDGIIFASNSMGEDDIVYMNENRIPIVVLDRAPGKSGCTVIRSQNAAGAVMAVRHLMETGCRKIAHIAGPGELITAQERLRGYRKAVKGFTWFDESLIVPGHFSIRGGERAVSGLLERHPDVDGIFAGNDLMAIGALKALQRMGRKIPRDISLCGFDGVEMSEWTEPELTTIAQPIYEMGRKAATHLIARIRGKAVKEDILELDVRLVERNSTRRRKN
ncbi:LacI family transcriptional regulator [Melghirimyces profundicolus]|uniref:LacI family transcriptional regulator n=1 Tax=Melghirimyces profundicolus TaxID=1242148 RepID=A0A2T6BV95_9BACL|nr:LacI family DNA-binding transcriptional regulator [Melghirimyces profundicolus]PTX59956.1 LacI family transcriptional regulator [Melghirimyces profundicolus]